MKHLDFQDVEIYVVAGDEPAMDESGGVTWSGNCAGSAQKIDRSIAYMRDHLNEPLQVAKLAALANVSASHYFALFKRRTGCAPIDFFIRLRMRQACRLLGGTSLSVKEVAAALGYEDPFYFSRMFKSVVAVAPSEYRAMYQGGAFEPDASPISSSSSMVPGSHARRPIFGNRRNKPSANSPDPVAVPAVASACAPAGI
jgi:AraC-like DNA-binding protein